MTPSRIPYFSDKSFDGMLNWFATMSERELLFHPDDPADTIYDTATGEATFTLDESRKAQKILEAMFSQFDDKVYEAAYPVFMKCMGLRLDS